MRYALGVALMQAGDAAAAAAEYREALNLDPRFFEARLNLGSALTALGRVEEAIAEYQSAARQRPDSAEAQLNLSNALRDGWQIDAAIAAARRAIELKPVLAEAHLVLGAALACHGDFAGAIAGYRKAIALRPDYATAHLNCALAELVMENFALGWPEYEWRRRCAAVIEPRPFSQPAWNGEDLSGKTILLYGEQGLGDAIHFIRYAPLLAKRGAKVVVEVTKPLLRLLGSVAGIDRLIAWGGDSGAFDFHCPLPSLPGIFATDLQSIPAEIPYLSADTGAVQTWRGRIAATNDELQVGLAWAGSRENRNDRNRSIALETFAALSAAPGVCFHSLQITPPPPADSPLKIRDWSAHITDLADTAALVANLDLIISVDTAVAHLAGAMGKRLWLLLPFPPDWRWMLDREDSPWYPTARLFRQKTAGDWNGVIDRVVDELGKLTSLPSTGAPGEGEGGGLRGGR